MDLCGPFKTYSMHHERTTIKNWLIVYCCFSISTKIVKVMNDYSTQSLIQSFITFSCEFGYSELGKGSQLVKGCKTMQLCFRDIKGNLHKDMMVESDIC